MPVRILARAFLLCALLAMSGSHAMEVEQMKSLAGASLLDLRVDALFEQCGLPSTIVDALDAPKERNLLHWKQQEMKLSPRMWTIHYSHEGLTASANAAWRNSQRPDATCLAGIASLVLDAKGESGILSVRKRVDDEGYITSYTVPDNLYTAHQIVSVTTKLKRGIPTTNIAKLYGAPSQIFKLDADVSTYRYWVVKRDGKMPLSAYAVDFEVRNSTRQCTRYVAYSSGVEFVQEKLDAMVREWQKVYVID